MVCCGSAWCSAALEGGRLYAPQPWAAAAPLSPVPLPNSRPSSPPPQFTGTPGSYTIVDGTNATVSVSAELSVCGSAVYPVSAVLLPALLLQIPQTTLAEAIAILSGGSGVAPAPAPAA